MQIKPTIHRGIRIPLLLLLLAVALGYLLSGHLSEYQSIEIKTLKVVK